MLKVTLYARTSGSRKPLKVKNINKIYPHGTAFVIRYTLDGIRRTETIANVSDVKLAHSAARAKEAALMANDTAGLESWKARYTVERAAPVLKPESKPAAAPKVLMLSAAVERYAQDIRFKSNATQDGYNRALKNFLQICGDKPISTITKNDLLNYQSWMTGNGHGDHTQYNRINCIVIFLRHFGIKDVRLKIRFTKKIVSAYRPDELDALFAAATPDEWLLFMFLLCTGMRDQEAQNCEFSDIDWVKQTVKVSEKTDWKPKDCEEREIPIPNALVEALKMKMATSTSSLIFPNRDGGRDTCMLKKLNNVVKRAKLPGDWGLHKFRKSFATLQHKAGVDARTIQKRLGHSDLATTLAYLEGEDPASERSRNQANETFGVFARAVKSSAAAVIMLVLVFMIPQGHAQEYKVLDAPLPVAVTKPSPKFFSGANKWLIIASAGLRTADAAQSCYHYSHGYREVTLPGQGCLTVIGWSGGLELAGVGVSKILHHYRHYKLELIPQMINAENGADGIIYSYTASPRKFNIPNPPVIHDCPLSACKTVKQ